MFCKKTIPGKRCVLGINHIGDCSMQPNGSITVRKIKEREEFEKKVSDE